MTDEFDAIRAAVAKTEATTERQLVAMATAQRALCEYRDELEAENEFLIGMVMGLANLTEKQVRDKVRDWRESKAVRS